MRGVIRLVNICLGAAVIGLFAFNMAWTLAYASNPGYSGLTWALLMTGLLLIGGLVQLARFGFGLFESRGELFLSLGLLLLGMGVDLYVWASVVAGFQIPHLAPLWVIAGYWTTYYGEIVAKGLIRQRLPGGVLSAHFVTPQEKIAALEREVLHLRSFPSSGSGGGNHRAQAEQPTLFAVPGVRPAGRAAGEGQEQGL